MDPQHTVQVFHLPVTRLKQAAGNVAVHHLHSREGKAELATSGDLSHLFGQPAANHLPALPEMAPVAGDGWCLTLLSRHLTVTQINSLLARLAEVQWPVMAIDTLSQDPQRTVIRFTVQGVKDFESARRTCLEWAETLQADLTLQPAASQTAPKLAGFDMDSTLIDAEVIDELAKITGIGQQVADITAAAMRGELDFQQSFRKRMHLLKGFSETRLAEIARELPIKEGAERLLSALHALGCKTAILSGGFTYFANFLQRERLAIDFVHANQLEFDDGALTGGVIEPIVDGARKRALLTQMAEELGLSLDQVIAVGDGANDIPMLALGALGIAIHPKPKVREVAPQSIQHFGLDAALYLFGLNDRQILTLLQK